MRITRKTLQTQIDMLNARLGRPTTSWTRDVAGNLRANPGCFILHGWNPGDGWTRYKLHSMCDAGGENDCTPGSIATAQELYAYLRGIHAMLDSQMQGEHGYFAYRGEDAEYSVDAGHPDDYLADAQMHALNGCAGNEQPGTSLAFDTLAHARYLIAENKPEDWEAYFAKRERAQ